MSPNELFHYIQARLAVAVVMGMKRIAGRASVVLTADHSRETVRKAASSAPGGPGSERVG